VRPSSSPSEREASPGGLFDGVLARGPVRDQVSDRAWLQAMLDAEAALAMAEAGAGLFDQAVAAAIADACDAANFEISAIGRRAADTGNPVVPLLKALRETVGEPAANHIHHGATSQDVIDTAAMLVASRALGPVQNDLRAAADAGAALADRHRGTLMAGRTLLQQASPITFGLKAAVWMSGLDRAADRVGEVHREVLAVQLGGAVGSLASLGPEGPAVLARFAKELGLAEPVLPWHTNRWRIAELASALGEAAGAVGKPALDVVLMAQTEIGEVREGVAERGGSSAMPHKRNPIAAISALACAKRAPGLVGELLAAGLHEHERAAGSWHAEWRPLTELLIAVGSAAAWLGDCLEHLEVDPDRMGGNLGLLTDLVPADPSGDVRSAETFIDRALAARRSAGRG
jgi:3-carboxy-cis,cis-muconate cycloisomerase